MKAVHISLKQSKVIIIEKMKIKVVLEIQNISTVAKYLYKAAQTKLRKLIFSKNTFLKIN